MADKLKPEEVWFLKKMVELSEKDLAEGRTYTHEQVKEYIKSRWHKVYTSLCIAALFVFMLASCKGQTNQTPHTGIYICDSPWAQCYHTDYDCEGLQQCGSAIREVTEAEAQKMGRKSCSFCTK